MTNPDLTTEPTPGTAPVADGTEMVIDYAGECFLCRRTMGKHLRKTKEDVVPKWLVRLAGLATTVSTLPSGQKFPYHQRVVPCCIE